MASRNASYKVKSTTMDKREKKLMRVHRRSIDQREQRQDEVNKRRQLDSMTPVLESVDGSKNPSKAATPAPQKNAATSRLEMLKKWKQERELKRKLDALEKGRNKPGFRITHLSYNDKQVFKKDTQSALSDCISKQNKFGSGASTVKTVPSHLKPSAGKALAAKPLSTKPAGIGKKSEPIVTKPVASTTRVTRSRAAAATASTHRASPIRKTLKALPSKTKISPRVKRNHFMAPTAASRTRAAGNQNKANKQKESDPTQEKDTSKVSSHHGEVIPPQSSEPSFAPSDFVFEAPSSVSSFVFKPLSPSSVAGFLFPNGNNTTMSAFTDRVRRTSTPKMQRLTSTEQSGSAEMPVRTSCSDADFMKNEDEKPQASSQVPDAIKGTPKTQASPGTPKTQASPGTPKTQASEGTPKTQANEEKEDVREAETAAARSEKESRASQSTLKTQANAADQGKPAQCAINTNVRMTPSADSDLETIEVKESSKKQMPGNKQEKEDVREAETAAAWSEKESRASQTPVGRRRSVRASQLSTPALIEGQKEPGQLPSVSSASSRRRSTRHSEVCAQANTPVEHDKTPVRSSRRNRSCSAANADSDRQEKSEPMEVVQEEEVPVFAGVSFSVSCNSEQLQKSGKLTPAKKTPRRSLRSLRSSVAESVSDTQVVDQPTTGLETVAEDPDNEVKKSPGHAPRHSRRSTVASTDGVLLDDKLKEEKLKADAELPGVEVRETPRQGLRRSLRSSVATVAAAVESEVPTDTPQGGRQGRRSSVAQVESAPHPSDKAEFIQNVEKMQMDEPASASKEASLMPLTHDLKNVSEDSKVVENASPLRTRSRHGLSEDDGFLTPGMPLSIKRQSTAKRRRTAAMIALSTAKSPEEAIKIISNSPMVEMTRRTPKLKTPPELNKSVNELFEDVDTLLARPVRLFADSGEEILQSDELAAAVQQDGQEASVEVKRDVTPFRKLHSGEIEKLTALADKWTVIGKTTPALTEEVEGQIRTVACQARLLMAQKLNQFSGLVDKCEAGDPTTNCQDLQGFWDMVYMQAVDVYNKFEDLDKLQQNNWNMAEVKAPEKKAPIKKKATVAKKDKPVGKSNFAAFRAQMMKQQHKAEEMEEVTEEKVFDAGFFTVSSPVKTQQYHCEGSTPKKGKTPTPNADPKSDKQDIGKTSAASPAPSQTPKSNNKENLHEKLLRRSVGGTPFRRSYVPAVPSPLLQDITPLEDGSSLSSRRSFSARRSLASEDQTEKHVTIVGGGDNAAVEIATSPDASASGSARKSIPRRKSTRKSKSVTFAAYAEETLLSPDTKKVAANEEPMDIMAYFQPSTSKASPLQASSLENSPFSPDSILIHSGKNSVDTSLSTTPQLRMTGRRKSSLKILPSAERRRSRRSVSFAASPNGVSYGSHGLPSTPYNRNSLAASRRVSRYSLSSPGELDSKTTPHMRRSARPSLLYTPPKVEQPQTPAKEIPVAVLVSFSP